MGGDGASIAYNKMGTNRYFYFILGWGDCPSGCICKCIRSYTVNSNCLVTFQGCSGRYCNINDEKETDLIANCNITIALR